MKKTSSTLSVYITLALILWCVSYAPTMACPSDGKQCSSCILDRFKTDCPPCAPMLRCMARCLWGGKSRAKCVAKCDCNNNKYPRLSDCKRCMSKCKCSCSLESA